MTLKAEVGNGICERKWFYVKQIVIPPSSLRFHLPDVKVRDRISERKDFFSPVYVYISVCISI